MEKSFESACAKRLGALPEGKHKRGITDQSCKQVRNWRLVWVAEREREGKQRPSPCQKLFCWVSQLPCCTCHNLLPSRNMPNGRCECRREGRVSPDPVPGQLCPARSVPESSSANKFICYMAEKVYRCMQHGRQAASGRCLPCFPVPHAMQREKVVYAVYGRRWW